MSEVIQLIFTGMGTVFLILVMVVVLGNSIIRITNLFASPPEVQVVNETKVTEIEPAKLAVLVTAVETLTKGKGRISSVEKMK